VQEEVRGEEHRVEAQTGRARKAAQVSMRTMRQVIRQSDGLRAAQQSAHGRTAVRVHGVREDVQDFSHCTMALSIQTHHGAAVRVRALQQSICVRVE
jgi:hypothetical protein